MSYQINGIAAMPPTGSIIAYYGTSDPNGWVICDGVERPNTNNMYQGLKDLNIGSLNTTTNYYIPLNLKGYFLRGIGQVDSNHIGPTNLGDIQQDEVVAHNHSFNSQASATIYATDTRYLTIATTGGTDYTTGINSTGGQETRPVNIGVNWIMKL